MRPHLVSLVSLVLVVAFAVPGPGTAQDPDLATLLERHAEARGGAEAWRAVEGMTVRGTFTAFSIPASFVAYKDGERYRFDGQWADKPVQIYLTERGAWWRNGWMGPHVAPMPPLDKNLIVREALLTTPFLDPERHGVEVKLVGRGELEGMEGYQLEVRYADGYTETWYLAPDTYLEMARVRQGSDFGRPVEEVTWFDDFREVDGLVIPHLVESLFRTRNRTWEIDTIELGRPDPVLYQPPPPQGMGELLDMEGDWQVTTVQPSRDGSTTETTAHSSITRLDARGTALQERVDIPTLFGYPVEAILTWTYDPYQARYRVTEIHEISGHMNILEGTLEDGVLTVDNLETGTSWELMGQVQHLRLEVKDGTTDGFTVLRQTSFDAGENWMPATTMTYVRME